jgi:hypothetical protein
MTAAVDWGYFPFSGIRSAGPRKSIRKANCLDDKLVVGVAVEVPFSTPPRPSSSSGRRARTAYPRHGYLITVGHHFRRIMRT